MSPRPVKWRLLSSVLKSYFFRPHGVSMAGLEVVDLKGDELEAMRLSFVERLTHENAAKRMRVSRRTLERILYAGRRKVTQALLDGNGISITFPKYVSFVSRSQRTKIKRERR